MINVVFKKKFCNLISAKLEGHADSVDSGYDLVCCAVSVLSQSILIGLTEVLNFNIEYSIENGFLSFSLSGLKKKEIESCQVLMKTMLLGLKSIEASCGKYISICVEEV